MLLNKYIKQLWKKSRFDDGEHSYWLTRFLFLRLLGFTYFFAFLSLWNQLMPLLGSNGLTPIATYLPNSVSLANFIQLPTLFWFSQSDQFLMATAGLGLVISFLLLIGYANVPMLFINWLIYLSYTNAGQVWYGYGWEIQLVETGFLAIFLVPLLDPRPFNRKLPPPKILIWLLRWLAVRVNIGSGLIKLKGVPCWENLTCLDRFFQTQPIPNPVSPWMHALPSPLHKLGVLYTHFVQLVAPYSAVFENDYRKLRIYGGLLMISMQVFLIFVGNLSFLNWITLAATVSFLDDKFLARVFPGKLVEMAEKSKENAGRISDRRHGVHLILLALVLMLSVPVVINLVSPVQSMNTSFNNWNFVNSYGAFGSVREQRTELVIEGTTDSNLSDGAVWKQYDFPAKLDSVTDPHPVIAPYQPRIAWQLWFASMSQPEREPWLIHLVWKLLENDPQGTAVLKDNPFQDRPPEYIRIRIYRYEMQSPMASSNWERELLGTWMPPISKNNTQIRTYVRNAWAYEFESKN